MHKKSLFHKLRYQLLQREVFSFLKTIGTLMPTRTLIEDFVFELDKSVKCNINIENKKRKKRRRNFLTNRTSGLFPPGLIYFP